jgi:SAM-dependent methyltransferase
MKNSDNALQITIADKCVQAYLQRHPFGVGFEAELNRQALVDLRRGLHLRPASAEAECHSADPTSLNLSAEEVAKIKRSFERLRVPEFQQRWAWRSLAWKLMGIPRDARSVLSIGCGGGTELILIRSLLPHADLVAVDFDDKMPPTAKEVLRVRFFQEHFNDVLGRSERAFDLVFCNHVLEHLYEPEVTLRLIRRSLKPSGQLVAGLPMEGCADGVFTSSMRRMASRPSSLHILDVGVLDAGHAWKTNPSDLRATLERQGFNQVELHICKKPESSLKALARVVGILFYAVSFGAARKALRVLSSELMPAKSIRWFLAAERRCWFGANRLKNRFAKEVLVQARVADTQLAQV